MKTIGKLAVIVAVLCALTAIWVPTLGGQSLLTAMVALFVGSAILGRKDHP